MTMHKKYLLTLISALWVIVSFGQSLKTDTPFQRYLFLKSKENLECNLPYIKDDRLIRSIKNIQIYPINSNVIMDSLCLLQMNIKFWSTSYDWVYDTLAIQNSLDKLSLSEQLTIKQRLRDSVMTINLFFPSLPTNVNYYLEIPKLQPGKIINVVLKKITGNEEKIKLDVRPWMVSNMNGTSVWPVLAIDITSLVFPQYKMKE
jgi:hypothetical protein